MFLYIHCCVYMYCSNVELHFQSMGVAEVVGEGGNTMSVSNFQSIKHCLQGNLNPMPSLATCGEILRKLKYAHDGKSLERG